MAEEEHPPTTKKRALEDDDHNSTENGQGPAKKVDLKESSE